MLLDPYVSDKPVVVYDTHEARAHVIRYLKTFEDISLVKRPLEIADYLVQTPEGTMAIERKRASDFLSSISDGRLFTQLENLMEYTDARIILEGAIFTGVKSGRCFSIDTLGKTINKKTKKARTQPRTMWSTQFFIHPHAFIAIFKKIQDMGITIIPTGSAYDTADILHYWATQDESKEHIAIRRKPKTFTDLDKQLFLLAGLTGVNAKRAEALLEEFGTPMRVFNALLEYSPKKFPVGGIGEKTVSDIKKILIQNLVETTPRRLIEHEFRTDMGELRAILCATETDLQAKTIPQIKNILKNEGLRVTGTKPTLIQRLLDTMTEEEMVDTVKYCKKYEDIKRSKTEFQAIPADLQKAYWRYKGKKGKKKGKKGKKK